MALRQAHAVQAGREKRIAATLLTAFLLCSLPSVALAQSASKLNEQGQHLLKKKKVVQALAVFQQAADLDPALPSVQYNLARALSMIREHGDICAHGAEKSRILRHLFKGVGNNTRLKRQASRDKAFESVRDTFAFQRLMGLSIRKTAHVTKLLQRISWFGPSQENGRPGSGIEFSRDGGCTLWIRNSDHAQAETRRISCTYQVQANLVHVVLKEPWQASSISDGALMETGELVLAGLPGPFTDDPHDCPK